MGSRPQDFGLLVVSDLHLSAGRHGEGKRFSRNEDFFFDEEFARFLAHYQDAARWNGARWHLVVAGDLLDLLQVVSTEGAPDDLRRDRDRPGFGLACGPRETVFKVRRIAEGHWLFFEALAAFVASGNPVTILKGNHDVELHYRAVQEAFLEELQRALDRLPPAPGRCRAVDPRAVRFGEWFHHEEGLIWIEHGNQYDGQNAFRTWLAPLLPAPPGADSDVDLPLGSLFVRYLFNRIESVEPFADNLKPQSRFIGWLLTRHPITALEFLLRDGCYMLRKVRRALTRRPADALRVREEEHRARLRDLAGRSGIEPGVLERIDSLRARNVLEETTGALWRSLAVLVRLRLAFPLAIALLALATGVAVAAAAQVVASLVPPVGHALASVAALRGALALAPWALLAVAAAAGVAGLWWALTPEEKAPSSPLRRPAEQIARQLGVRYVVMGHTHDADLYPLEGPRRDGAPRGEYFNVGTWTKVFSEEERLIRDDVALVFLEGLRRGEGQLRLKLMEWNDAAGEPRLVKLFEDGEPVVAGR